MSEEWKACAPKCDCGYTGDTWLIDGYSFGDRQLEGVSFKATYIAGEWSLVWDDECRYLSTLNEGYWMDIGKDALHDADLIECPQCHNEEIPLWVLPSLNTQT